MKDIKFVPYKKKNVLEKNSRKFIPRIKDATIPSRTRTQGFTGTVAPSVKPRRATRVVKKPK